MSDAEQHAWTARQLLNRSLHGMLSTHSTEHPGHPFGSMAPYVLGHDGLPLFLLSHLSQHTRNVVADNRCGLLLAESGDGDIQQLGRLSAPGEMHPVTADSDAERYFRYYPQTRSYFEQLGFRFFRFQPLRFHWNGGFATARWFGNERIVRGNPFAHAETALIDRLDQMAGSAITNLSQPPAAAKTAQIIGIDSEGIDLRRGESIERIALPVTAGSFDELLEAVQRP